MVSGFVTSPCDQLRIFSGEARLMRMASKSAIGLAMSKGLERYKMFLHSCGPYASASGSCDSAFGRRSWVLDLLPAESSVLPARSAAGDPHVLNPELTLTISKRPTANHWFLICSGWLHRLSLA